MENETRAHTTTPAPPFENMKDSLGPLLTQAATTLEKTTTAVPGTTSRGRPTPPATPPSACSPHPSWEGAAETVSPQSLEKGLAAPTSAVDDVAEKFGRPRAHSTSRRDMYLPAWEEEEDAEGGAAITSSGPSRLEDRRRAVSMSFAEEYRRGRPSRQASALQKQCVDCHLSPSFAMEGEPAIYCRAHQLEGMVNVLREACTQAGCQRTASYGFPGEGRQRCFSHMEEGMAHVLEASTTTEVPSAHKERGTTRRMSS